VEPEGYNLLGRLRRKWEDKITMDRKGIGWDADEKGKVVGSCEHRYKPYGSINAVNILTMCEATSLLMSCLLAI